ncbi:nitroreductase [Commensalibacter papalotli (ex Botero et al. 2024)]|uniref:Putative NAD(P)H nitroreductase n=1 Tax=Commensalibacter papalotli (ex Botero et al. 2024) TaxID=2972766 RepID=A0ABM9HNN9_9PROT|nr:nitroreductase [Commensalibacter papalotli (ex Botero et al. 2024)]CAI3935091.1 Nitroreductase (NfnB) (PDB:1F5V) [Commensalibacter papalotli (ex Botero et al. 2024)]CAI3940634.1 Nitroreductase (NfnB) (PDB:1F5V) [Commensalibacter papalotli (ex Botero et al. 2024)]
MTNIDFLLSRFSSVALRDPVPDDQQLHQILSAAMCAPDHGRLRPWRFVVIPKNKRAEWLKSVEQSMTEQGYDYPESYIKKVQHNFSCAPMVIALGMRKITEKTSVSIDEQLMASSAAVMNVLNAVHALGFAAKWITGPIDNKGVVKHIGFSEPYRMLGFLFVGTLCDAEQTPPRLNVDDYVVVWDGKPAQFKVDQ